MRSLLRSFGFALEGLAYALRTQRNMRIHFVAAFVIITLCTVMQVSTLETMAVLFAVSLVITLELVNTAVEHIVDLHTRELHPLAKAAKDVSAAAVFIAAANALVVAYLIFFDKWHPIAWRPMQTLFVPPFLGVLLVGSLCLLVAVTAYAMRYPQGVSHAEEGSAVQHANKTNRLE